MNEYICGEVDSGAEGNNAQVQSEEWKTKLYRALSCATKARRLKN